MGGFPTKNTSITASTNTTCSSQHFSHTTDIPLTHTKNSSHLIKCMPLHYSCFHGVHKFTTPKVKIKTRSYPRFKGRSLYYVYTFLKFLSRRFSNCYFQQYNIMNKPHIHSVNIFFYFT